MLPSRVLHQADQDVPDGLAVAGVAEDHRGAGVEVEGFGDVVALVAADAAEAVDGDDEGDLAVLEVVDGREAVGQAAGVG